MCNGPHCCFSLPLFGRWDLSSCNLEQAPEISSKMQYTRVTLQLNGTLYQKLASYDHFPLLVLHTIPIIFFLPTCNCACLEVVSKVEWRATYFGALRAKLTISIFLGCQNEFGPQWTVLETPLFKSPHCVQACTVNSPNREGVVCKTTNFRPKVMLS